MRVYNVSSLDRNSRFIKALVIGFICAIALGIIYGLLYQFLRIQMYILYVGIGYCIGQVIQKTGRGVTKKFAILGACLTVLAIFIGDSLATVGFTNLLSIMSSISGWSMLIRVWLTSLLSTNIFSILGLFLRAAGVVFAYQNSVIL